MKRPAQRLLLMLLLLSGSSALQARIFHIDPARGSMNGNGSYATPWRTLEEVISQNLIESRSYKTPYNSANPGLHVRNAGASVKAGDTLLLYSGLHGRVELVNYVNSSFISILAAEGEKPIIEKIHLQAAGKWRFEGLTVSTAAYGYFLNEKLIFLESHSWQGPVRHIEIIRCAVYSDSAAWSNAQSWNTKASDGIMIRGDSILIYDNQLKNIRFGISMTGDHIRVAGNEIVNFSGDAIRINGSYNLVEDNLIKNCNAVDQNHDDGIQSFTTGGLTVDYNVVRRNIILNYEDPAQPLLGDLQGIGCFNGPYRGWIIENNLVIVNTWHGISMYGAKDCRIVNNTVIDPAPGNAPTAWIKIADAGSIQSSGCVVRNNLANDFQLNQGAQADHNLSVASASEYIIYFRDPTGNDYRLLPASAAVDAGDTLLAPAEDLDGNPRPSGPLPDVGAFEYQYPASGIEKPTPPLRIWPNPFSRFLVLKAGPTAALLEIFDFSGRLCFTKVCCSFPVRLDLEELPRGIYFLRISGKEGLPLQSLKLLKL